MATVNWIDPWQWNTVDASQVWRDQDGNAYATVGGQQIPIETRSGGMMDRTPTTYGYMGDKRTALELPSIQSIMDLPLAPNEGRGGIVSFGNGPRVDWTGAENVLDAWKALPAPEMGQGWMQGAQWSPERNQWERMYAAPQMGDTFLDSIAPGLALAGVAGITGAGLMGLGGAGGAGAATTGAGATGAGLSDAAMWAGIGGADAASGVGALGFTGEGLGALGAAGAAGGSTPLWAAGQAGTTFNTSMPWYAQLAEAQTLGGSGLTAAEMGTLGVSPWAAQIGAQTWLPSLTGPGKGTSALNALTKIPTSALNGQLGGGLTGGTTGGDAGAEFTPQPSTLQPMWGGVPNYQQFENVSFAGTTPTLLQRLGRIRNG